MSRLALLTAIVSIAAAALCVAHGDHGDVLDMCLSLLALAPGILLTAPLALTRELVAVRSDAYSLCPLDRPPLPPEA